MLDGCLASITRALRPGDEVVVVDSASRESARVRAVSERHGARYLRCDRPGASLARNTGWRSSRNDIIAFVDDDVRVAPSWISAVGAAVVRHPDAGFFVGRIEVPPEQAGTGRPVAHDEGRDVPEELSIDTVGPIGHGANAALRREVLAEVVGFDEQFGPGGLYRAAEDYDLFDRVLGLGYIGRYEPAMLAWHDQWRTKRDLVRLDWSYGIGSGARLAKLARTDRRRLRPAAVTSLWVWGLAPLVRDARNRYKLGVAAGVSRLAGVLTGFVRGLCRPVRAGHYARRTV
jgi:glycosyltransferase involved in cell wall biosynthesis